MPNIDMNLKRGLLAPFFVLRVLEKLFSWGKAMFALDLFGVAGYLMCQISN